jgi:serine/threonine protein kinase
MKQWLLKAAIHVTEIQPHNQGREIPFFNLPVNLRVNPGDLVYMAFGGDHIYGWGTITRIESSAEDATNLMTVTILVNRIQQGLIPGGAVRSLPQLVEPWLLNQNFVELDGEQISLLRGLFPTNGAIPPPLYQHQERSLEERGSALTPTIQNKFEASTLQAPVLEKQQATAPDIWVGKVLRKKYRIIEKLGAGGLGTVYRAQIVSNNIGLEVAVKILHSNFQKDEKAIARFRREARTGTIDHQNVVRIQDFYEAEDDSPAFIEMELLKGESLDNTIKHESRINVHRAIHLMREICKGVGAGHRRQIIHRDLKPANIMLLVRDENDDVERVKVLDFGLAKLLEEDLSQELTEIGTVLGTAVYMSPEQCRGQELDKRSDVYSLGVILYEMLVGKPPFRGSSREATIHQHLHGPNPTFPSTLNLDSPVQQIVLRALSRDRDNRQTDANVLLTELKSLGLLEAKQPLVSNVVDIAVSNAEGTTIKEHKTSRRYSVSEFDEDIDEFVFETCCELALGAQLLENISVPDLVKHLGTQLDHEVILDSLEILSDKFFIHLDNTTGCGLRICSFGITSYGFEEYLQRNIDNYDFQREKVAESVALGKVEFEKPEIIVEHILDQLQDDGSIKIAKYLGGKIKVIQVFAKLKRRYRFEEPLTTSKGNDEAVEPMLISRASKIGDEIRSEKHRAAWRTSSTARNEAQEEVGRLFEELIRSGKALQNKIDDIRVEHDSDECILKWRGVLLLASWNPGRVVNRLTGTGLIMKVTKQNNVSHDEWDETQLRQERYDIDIGENNEIGWSESSGSRQILSSTRLVEIWMHWFIEAIEQTIRSS